MISIVTCHICGEDWDERDERVVFTSGLWECYDESACLSRVAELAAQDQQGGWVSGGCA